jgi:guanyl-specific ribonuclease Sa
MKKYLVSILILLAFAMFIFTNLPLVDEPVGENERPEVASPIHIEKDGQYTSVDEVAAYIDKYGVLPSNFITKAEATKLGWKANEGNLWDVAKGMSIGGDRFGNREGLLPAQNGREYYECDIHYEGGYRGAERIVFSNDGLIFYTADHYETFEQLYGEE